MTNYPSESSLVVNATQQQLSQSPFTDGIAISPSQREEKSCGYDIAFETATRLELQYKAIYGEIKNRTFKKENKQNAVKFPFYGSQAETLNNRQTAPGTTFYALPVVTTISDLNNILTTTVFLDVRGLRTLRKAPCNLNEYTAFWIPVTINKEGGDHNYTPIFSELYLKDGEESQFSKPKAYERIKGQYIYSWEELSILTRFNVTGVPLRINGGAQIAEGYRKLLAFESQLSAPCSADRFFPDQNLERVDIPNPISHVARSVSKQSIQVGEAITNDRPDKSELSKRLKDILSNHQYLLDPEFNIDRHQKEIEPALTWKNGKLSEPQISYGDLNPYKGSKYRQYRFLSSGKNVDGNNGKITAPISHPDENNK